MSARNSLHPQARAHLERLVALAAPPLEQLTPAVVRRQSEEASAELTGPAPAVAQVTELEVAGGDGPVPARLYRPSLQARLPALVYLHGGGWVIGTLDTYDVLCRRLALAAGCAVLSVGYRLAPEHPFPAAVTDAIAATSWLLSQAPDLDLDPGAVAVGGDSAGGTLAAVTARHLGDRGLAGQLLIYPVTDAAMDTESFDRLGDGHYLTAEGMRWYWDRYLADPGGRSHPDASPLRASDLSGLAPAHVLVASHDPLRDEGLAYAERLREAGVAVTVREVHGHLHGFLRWTAVVDAAGEEIERLGTVLQGWFDRS